MKKQITNVRAVLPDKILTSATVAFEDGKITYVGNEIQPGYEIIDGENNYLLAGFVEIHCHGGNNLEFMDASPEEIKELAKYHLKNGTTTLYATTMTDTWEAIESALCNYAEVEKAESFIILRAFISKVHGSLPLNAVLSLSKEWICQR